MMIFQLYMTYSDTVIGKDDHMKFVVAVRQNMNNDGWTEESDDKVD